jgi:hypothetical protein
MYLVKIEDEIQFADIVEVVIEHLNEIVNGFQIVEIIVHYVHANTKVKASVSPVNNFEVAKLRVGLDNKMLLFFDDYLDKVCMLCVANRHHCMHFLYQLLLFVVVKVHIPFGQPSFSCAKRKHNCNRIENTTLNLYLLCSGSE